MLDPNFLDAIKRLEGYTAKARWDYAQNTNGYGTRARFAGEVIDKAEADKRFADAINKAANFVDKFAPGLDDGSKAALTSLTYNAGTAWTQSGLGDAISTGDLGKARSLFLQYTKAGGNTLDGLVQRRLQEVTWFGAGDQAGRSSIATAELEPESNPGAGNVAVAVSGGATDASSSALGAAADNDAHAPFSGIDGDTMLFSLLSELKRSAPTAGDEQSRKADVQQPRSSPTSA